MATGCGACHNGANLGGTMFQRFGQVKDYWTETGSQKIDQGRFAATKKEEDRFVFRVPMLRNVAKTAPYFHDGSVDSWTARFGSWRACSWGARSTTRWSPTSSPSLIR